MGTSKTSKNNLNNGYGNQETTCDSCPHWSPNTQSCLVVQDGLFLPTTEHIITYCETPFYPSCSYYQQHLQQIHYKEVSDGEWQNRRQHPRVPYRQVFRFSEQNNDGTVGDIRDDSACTIDLSIGGIRFETREHLRVNTDIRFILNGDGAHLEGIGRVVWSKPIENSPVYHCGFVFSGSDLSTQVEQLLAS